MDEIRELNNTFQSQHIDASALLDPTNEELIKKDLEELDTHDDRVRDNISKLLYVLSLASNKPQDAKSTERKGKRSLDFKWNRITKAVNSLAVKTSQVQDDLAEIADLADMKTQFFDLENEPRSFHFGNRIVLHRVGRLR